MGKPDLRGAGMGSTPERGWGGWGGRPRGMRWMRRGGTQTTGEKGPHEGGGRIAHQSTACNPTGTKVRRKNIVRIRRVHVKCGQEYDQKTASYLNVDVKGWSPIPARTSPLDGIIKPGRFDRYPGKVVSEWESKCVWEKEKSARLSSPSLTAESSPLVFSPLTPPLPMGRQRSHLTAEYTLSQALSLSLSHTFAPAPQRPFLNFSPSLHYLMLSISHFHALNRSYCSAQFHLLFISLSFIVAFSQHDSNNPVLSFGSILAFYLFAFLSLFCHSGPFLSSFSLLCPILTSINTLCASLIPTIVISSFPPSVPLSPTFWHLALLCFVLYHNDGTRRAICLWLAELCV